MRFASRLSLLSLINVPLQIVDSSSCSLRALFNLGFQLPELSCDQVVLKAKPRKVIKHSFGGSSVRGPAVRSDAPSDRPLYQGLFGYLAKYQVQRSVDTVPRDLL